SCSFFFSSRRRHTRFSRDWSSDVCSSDLQAPLAFALEWRKDPRVKGAVLFSVILYALMLASIVLNLSSLARDGAIWHAVGPIYRSEERRVGRGWGSLWWLVVDSCLCGVR